MRVEFAALVRHGAESLVASVGAHDECRSLLLSPSVHTLLCSSFVHSQQGNSFPWDYSKITDVFQVCILYSLYLTSKIVSSVEVSRGRDPAR